MNSLGDTKGERAMASCTGEKGDRAAVSETPGAHSANQLPPLATSTSLCPQLPPIASHLECAKMLKSLDDDVLDTNLDILFVGYRAESSLQPILSALAQASIAYPKLTIQDGARGALENRIGFLHVCNELGDWGQIKSSIGFVVQKLMLFKPRLICFSSSTIWRAFVNFFAPEVDVNDVFYGLQTLTHPIIDEKLASFFFVLPSQLLANQAVTLFAEIKLIKERIVQCRHTNEQMSLNDLRHKLHEAEKSKRQANSSALHIVDETEKKTKKRGYPDHDYQQRVKMARTENNPPTSQLPTNTIQHRLSGGGIADNLLKDPSENERMERVKKWVNEQDFDNASPEPNLDQHCLRSGGGGAPSQVGAGLLAAHPNPHELYKTAAAQSALLTTPWAAAAAAATGLTSHLTDPNYLNALSHLIPSQALANFPAVPIAGLGGSQLSNAAWPYGTGMSSLYLRPPALQTGHMLPDWEKMMGATSQAELIQQSESSRVIPAFGIGLIQAQPSAFLLPSQTQMIYPPGFTPQEKDPAK